MTDDLQTEISKKDAAMQFIKRLFVFILVGAGGLFILLFLMSFLFMFEGLACEDNLAGGYVVQAGDMRNSAAIFRETEVVPPMVFAYGWNEDFIIAKRHWGVRTSISLRRTGISLRFTPRRSTAR